jgi:hypothetical protein
MTTLSLPGVHERVRWNNGGHHLVEVPNSVFSDGSRLKRV